MTLLILRGLPGSGKTTYARHLVRRTPGWVRVDQDDIRVMLGIPHSPMRENLVHNIRNSTIAQSLSTGWNVVSDDTNLKLYQVQQLLDLVRLTGNTTKIIHIDCPVEECIRRDSLREQPVGRQTILDMWAEYLKRENAVFADEIINTGI